jgi:hypothetical protein
MNELTSGLLGYLSLLVVVFTVVWLTLETYRAALASREEDALFLTEGEAKEAEAQHVLVDKLKRLTKPLWVSGISVGVLLFVIYVILLWRVMTTTP